MALLNPFKKFAALRKVRALQRGLRGEPTPSQVAHPSPGGAWAGLPHAMATRTRETKPSGTPMYP